MSLHAVPDSPKPVSLWPPELRSALALIAIVGAAARVTEVAQDTAPALVPAPLDQALWAATANRNPADWDALFPQPALLAGAASHAQRLLAGQGGDRQTLLYTMQLIALAERLGATPQIKNALTEHLDKLETPSADALAGIYQATISNLGHRIQVSGNPQALARTEVAAQIRALLLAGVRFGWLWRSQGGRRRHLVLGRRKLLRTIQAVQDRL